MAAPNSRDRGRPCRDAQPAPVPPGANDRSAARRPSRMKALPEIWKLIKPLRRLLLASLALMMVNRACGFAIPIASRYLIDNVLLRRDFQQLPAILGSVVAASGVQAVTTFVLNQQLSISGQRLIAELRIKVQRHIGRLPIAFYDGNPAGALASRIMSDVEGVKNLVGAGMIDFVSGIVASMIAIVIMLRVSWPMTAFTLFVLLAFGCFLKGVFGVTRPIFRQRAEMTAQVTGRLIESLAGIRVVKGYRAEESETAVFAAGARRLLQNLIRSTTALDIVHQFLKRLVQESQRVYEAEHTDSE